MLRTQLSKALLKSHSVKAWARVGTATTSRFVSDTTSATFRSIYEKGSSTPSPYDGTDSFPRRHLGPTPNNVDEMLQDLKESDLDSFIAKVVPDNVLIRRSLKVEPLKGFTESEMLAELARIAEKNDLVKPLIGKGFYGTIIPPVILRNLLENPGWYTSYTPYQPEVSQGRLESLLNFQTVISDLTGLPVANASLLDESSAAAEAMILSFTSLKSKKPKYFVDSNIHEQTLAVLKSRAHTLSIEVVVADLTTDEGFAALQENKDQLCGAMVQYPATDGSIETFKAYSRIAELVHSVKGLYAVASDLMALTLLHAPSKFGADIVFGSSQRFGVPLGYGGPHAAFFSVVESLQRKIPGRIVGVSKDRLGNNALRLALQTREQHIKRERATSNICTAQALLANIAANYVVYHGIEGLRNISKRIHGFTTLLANSINESSSHKVLNEKWFDTLSVDVGSADEFIAKALSKNFNVFRVNNSTIQLSLDETVTKNELTTLISLFTGSSEVNLPETLPSFYEEWTRQDDILTNEVFRTHRSETSMLRYLTHLQKKDISLADSMISLGSCTMKLNATVEMMPISWPKFANIHPFAPKDQVKGYTELIVELEKDLADITGFHSTTLQPNSGAQGEYTGLSVIAKYFESKGEAHRNIVLIPVSAHGTNPASAAMAGLKVVPIKCLKDGSLDLQDLESKASKHAKNLAAMMVTYPSTYGLFEPGIIDAIKIIHNHGGQVYLDGANMNAQVGLTSPGDLGADVCHLNLHKTFAIPHGGGGPGVGPICVKEHLTPFLPSHPIIATTNQTEQSINPVVAAPFGSASILPISYAYIKMMGGSNLQYSSIIAILNANYMVAKLKNHFEILFTGGDAKYCGHEFIIDLRPFKKFGIEAIDVAKRLQDYGFHAPTMSFPIPGTLMVEPTESEYKEELDRFIDSMISIREEIRKVENGETDGAILHNSPHNLKDIISTSDAEWSQRGYTREEAAYPLPFLKEQKTWPTVSRVDDTYGDMNLLCTCPSVEEVAASQ
ncbi:BA75_04297T0 [Komagataella pastoris]|uniref:Glycine cleavage system P protein n=1 Tax=Komagataella pastoris TaxID=4922 RepID=A0A1B2JH65_PICPA|nr:BA75_04297T0 [Komagataella pastoris]